MLAIYTKKGADLTNALSTSADIFQYKGYSIMKEFYSPDYAIVSPIHSTQSQQDNRITLYWQPDIIIDGADIKFPIRFYNNDRTKIQNNCGRYDFGGENVIHRKTIAPATKGFNEKPRSSYGNSGLQVFQPVKTSWQENRDLLLLHLFVEYGGYYVRP